MNSKGKKRDDGNAGRRAFLLGLGLDASDGHKRITRAEQFSVVGGSEETHERLTETFIKTCEDLKRKGRGLDDADPREIRDSLRRHLGDA